MKKVFSLLSLICLTWTLYGCQTTGEKPAQQTKTQSITKTYADISYKPLLSDQVEEIAESVKGVDDSVAVVMGKDFSLAVKVTGFDRFRLNQIKSEVTKKIKDNIYGEHVVHVTTDKKIYQELQSLRSRLSQGKESSKQIKKDFKKVNDDMHG